MELYCGTIRCNTEELYCGTIRCNTEELYCGTIRCNTVELYCGTIRCNTEELYCGNSCKAEILQKVRSPDVSIPSKSRTHRLVIKFPC